MKTNRISLVLGLVIALGVVLFSAEQAKAVDGTFPVNGQNIKIGKDANGNPQVWVTGYTRQNGHGIGECYTASPTVMRTLAKLAGTNTKMKIWVVNGKIIGVAY